MNIDLNALKVIEDKQDIDVDDLLTTIASALLFAYLDYREVDPGENTKSRVDIDPDTGDVHVMVSEVDGKEEAPYSAVWSLSTMKDD